MEPTSDEALLTAYLDGELTPQDRQHLEQRLASEPELRQRLVLLEETWHCLDLLEQECVDAEQIETTLKIVAISVASSPLATSTWYRFGRGGAALLVGVMVFLGTFQIGKQAPLDDPSFRQKIERLEIYRGILDEGGIELVRQLAIDRVFLPPVPDGVSSGAPSEYEPQHRSWFLGNFPDSVVSYHSEFDDAELYQLLYRNIQTYNRLTPDKAKKIQKLHQDIEAAPRQTELLLTAQNYYHWFKALQRYEQDELRKPRSITEKVAAIIELKTHLERQPGEMPVSSEIAGFAESSRLAETLAELPPWRKERLLNEEPIRILDELKQSAAW
jgi:hypothetical protein